ncbi:hypothetical protein B2J93_203 [Marssonina coronariae]|uniref:Uncharacterized protein n=1 Tax=Diplocarpon coronariae TaxID=2795749 RepID=A0A218YUH0_9HELO|nr:hypothetical protein B2J93_203 [Marssonina coronariae]
MTISFIFLVRDSVQRGSFSPGHARQFGAENRIRASSLRSDRRFVLQRHRSGSLLKFPLNLMLRGEILRLVRMGGDAASATQDTPPGSHRRNEVPSIDRWQRSLHEKYERDPVAGVDSS